MSYEDELTRSILKELAEKSGVPTSKISDPKEYVMPDEYKEPELFSPLDEETEDSGDGIKYSALFKDFGGEKYITESGLPDFVVTTRYDVDDWDEEEQSLIPDVEAVKHYRPDHTVLYPSMLAREDNLKVLTYGPTGSGKTDMYKFIAALCNQPYMRINGRADMESDSLLGKPWISEGTMTFELGQLPIGLMKGRLICFDEPWKTPSGIQMALQRYYERNGQLFLDDMPGTVAEKTITPHARASMVLCDNVVGTGDNLDQYGATMVQDSSTLNRMDLVLTLDYLSQDDEVDMMMARYKYLTKDNTRKMVQLANLIRTGYKEGVLSVTMSPRNLMSWAEMAYAVKNYEVAFAWTMGKRFNRSDSEAQAIKGHYHTVFGKTF